MNNQPNGKPAASDLLGFHKEELLRKNIAQLTHPEDFQNGIDTFRKIMNGETLNTEKALVNKSGEKVYVNLSGA